MMIKFPERARDVIFRPSLKSLITKGSSAVIVLAIFILSKKCSDAGLLPLALIPSLILWGLDAHLLVIKKAYHKPRKTFKETLPDNIEDSMDFNSRDENKDWFVAFSSKRLIYFHGSIFAIVMIVYYMISLLY